MNRYGTVALGREPLIMNFLSSGFLRGMCGLCMGCEACFFENVLKNMMVILRDFFVVLTSLLIECSFLFIICYLTIHQHQSNLEFLMYFVTAAILIVIDLGKSTIFRIFDNKAFVIMAVPADLIYVSHMIVIGMLKKTAAFIYSVPDIFMYAIVLCSSYCFGWLLYFFIKKAKSLCNKLILNSFA